MNIDKTSIIDLEEQFNDFGESISYYWYGVWMDARTFSFRSDKGEAPSLDDLRIIFYNKKVYLPHGGFFTLSERPEEIHGFIKKIDFEDVVHNVSQCLSRGLSDLEAEGSSSLGKKIPEHKVTIVDPVEAARRIKIFWDLIHQAIGLPPTATYELTSSHDIFSWHHYWTFSYVMLNNKTQRGIVVSAGAYNAGA